MIIGDDVNDIDLMKKVGLSSTPKDGIEQAKQIVDYICKSKGEVHLENLQILF